MTNSKNALDKSPSKLTVKPVEKEKTSTSQRVAPFHISPLLFRNRKLKQLRIKRAARPTAYRKTSLQYFPRPQGLSADVTINLLSDDDDAEQFSHIKRCNQNLSRLNGGINVQGKRIMVCSGKGPNITLIPVHKTELKAETDSQQKRKRKSRPPKRHLQPMLINHESIVLTDSEEEMEFLPDASKPTTAAYPTNTLATDPMPQFSQMVDEEVTVSLVPRSSAAGSCHNNNFPQTKTCETVPNSLASPFPMLPDETTVHTVIANRIYELSLSKLREGLASSPPHNSKCKTNPPAQLSPPAPAPVSLKLSSDLSISLISDDEEPSCSKVKFSPQKLRLQQPQLSIVQHHLPASLSMSMVTSNAVKTNTTSHTNSSIPRSKLC